MSKRNKLSVYLIKDEFAKSDNLILKPKQLKNKHINAMQALNSEDVFTSWTAYKCIYGELDLNGKSYCINHGRWFNIDKDFAGFINKFYNEVPVSSINFIDYISDFRRESEYTKNFVATDPQNLLCMDTKQIYYGGGHSSIELCDILTSDMTYIHIKPYTSSATLSHLFNQAVVSAELTVSDRDFRAKANERIHQLTDNPSFIIPANTKTKIVLAIISKSDADRPPIPFFSKVALKYATHRLEMIGCSVYIKNIKKIV